MSLHATYTARWQRHKVVPFDIRAGGAFRARRFPPGTRGFFYYYHDPTTPPLAGELRFRVTRDRDPSLFASGHDLLGDNGIPWRISLIQIASRKTFESIKDTLLEDGLVSETVIAKASTQSVVSSRILHSFEQPFRFGFGHFQQELLTVGYDAIRNFSLQRVGIVRMPSRSIPWITKPRDSDSKHREVYTDHAFVTGSAICHFEKSTLPEHDGRRVVVCRMLRVVDPIRINGQMRVPNALIPREGDLLRMSIREAKKPCWFVDVDSKVTSKSSRDATIVDALALLYDNEARARAIAAR
ncbi:hypothetical protein C8Q70DRAFT_1057228 [Cubamyces menziesii]|nr:hypothetical protein C8Q70DRAFT_1057228 [Cubamyces menziesii]